MDIYVVLEKFNGKEAVKGTCATREEAQAVLERAFAAACPADFVGESDMGSGYAWAYNAPRSFRYNSTILRVPCGNWTGEPVELWELREIMTA